MPAWITLMSAIAFEVAGTISMKLSDGFTRPLPSILIFVFYCASFIALTFAIKKIEVSVVYAVWAGVGTAIVAAIGIGYFGESLSAGKLFSLVLIIAGIVGLNLQGSGV